MMPELCADNLGTMSTQEEVGLCIGKRIGGLTRRQILPVWQYFRKSTLHLSQLYFLSSYTLKVYLLNNSSRATRYQVHFVVCLSCFSIQGLHKFSVLHVRGVWLLGCASKVA